MTISITTASANLPGWSLPEALRSTARAIGRWLSAVLAIDDNAGRERIFQRVLDQYQPMIRRICFSYADNQEDYEDLRQDILLNIWKGLAAYRADSSLSTWVYRVALNTSVSTLRSRKRDPNKVAIQELVGDIAADQDDAELKENLLLLHEAISMLSPVDKAIITMRLDECSYDEIAEVVGLNRNNVAVRINRIKKKLTDHFNKNS